MRKAILLSTALWLLSLSPGVDLGAPSLADAPVRLVLALLFGALFGVTYRLLTPERWLADRSAGCGAPQGGARLDARSRD